MNLDFKAFLEDKQLNKKTVLTLHSSRKAVNLFHQAAIRIPAYKDFLNKNKIDPKKINSVASFSKVPVMTKDNYIKKYSTSDRSWDGRIVDNHMISLSSGTTGEPIFWPRNLKTEFDGAIQHEFLFKKILKILKPNKKVLIINGFAMGNWIAGTFTYASLYLLAIKGYKFTISTPGYSLAELVKILKNFHTEYDIVVIAGHTPFLREVLENVRDSFKQTNIILLGTGQAVSEKLRGYLINLLGSGDYFRTFISLYGSADAALMGYETPFSIFLRKKLFEDVQLASKIFGNQRIPALYQYDPTITYFESINSELHITKYSGSPLVRYNIQDKGGILEHTTLVERMLDSISFKKDLKLNKIDDVQLPFVYLYGRDKFMVKVFGANIYSEQIENFLLNKNVSGRLSGKYKMEVMEDKKFRPVFICRFELKNPLRDIPVEMKNKLTELLANELISVNSEYKDALSRMGKKALPQLKFYEYGNSQYFPLGKVIKTS